jgi:hypothetical protein
MTACAVWSRQVWQSATLGLSLLLILAGAPTGAEPGTRAGSYEPAQAMAIPLASAATPTTTPPLRPGSQALLSRPPSNLILQLPDFGDRLPLFLWPVQGPVTSGFGLRRSGWHKGIDVKADRGAPVGASASGLVVASGFEDGYGYVVNTSMASSPCMRTMNGTSSESANESGPVNASPPSAAVGGPPPLICTSRSATTDTPMTRSTFLNGPQVVPPRA